MDVLCVYVIAWYHTYMFEHVHTHTHLCVYIMYSYGLGHKGAAVLLPGFAIKW